jgi:hypothetical protein
VKRRKNRGRETRPETELSEVTGLGVRGSIPRRMRLLLDSATGHLNYSQALPQMIDLDRGDREAVTRQVALPLQDRYVWIDLCRAGLQGCGGRRRRTQRDYLRQGRDEGRSRAASSNSGRPGAVSCRTSARRRGAGSDGSTRRPDAALPRNPLVKTRRRHPTTTQEISRT